MDPRDLAIRVSQETAARIELLERRLAALSRPLTRAYLLRQMLERGLTIMEQEAAEA